MAPNLDPDAALMLRVREGDSAAFEMLVEKYKQPVFSLVYRTLHDAAEAEDVAQNVFIQVHKSARRYRVTARFSTWLFTIARNLCLNELRRRSRHPTRSPVGRPCSMKGPGHPRPGFLGSTLAEELARRGSARDTRVCLNCTL